MEALKLLARDILDTETQMHYNFINHIENTIGMHKHDFYEIFLVLNGNVVHRVNGTKQNLLEGAIVFIRPEDVHYYEKYETVDCQFINLAFSINTLKDFFSYHGDSSLSERLLSSPLPPLKHLSVYDKETARKKLETITVLPRESKIHIKSYLRLLLADFMFNYFSEDIETKKAMPEWLAQLVNDMKRKENFSIGLKVMPNLSNRSQEYISRVFKETFGKTPTDFINELRLNYTANMLEYSNADISEIALEAGFMNLSHFYHLFKKQYGLSPMKYRKANQNLIKF